MNLKIGRYRLARRLTFRGLQISVETDKGQKRHWYDPHNKEHGTTTMKHAYGYIRRTEGVDGDHVDVYVGPNEDAKNVYIVHQMKAPDFKKFDEDKCMLGFDSLEDAKKAYLAHYNKPGFLGSVTTMSFEEFKEKVMKTYDQPKKLAEVIALIKQGNLRAGMKLLRPSAGVTGQAVAQRAGLTAAEAAGPAAGRMHAMVPSMTARPSFNAADVMNRVRQQGGEQALRDLGAKLGQHTMIGRPAPTWGLKGPTPQGFKAPTPAPAPGTAAGVPQQQHAWQQQASRTSAGSPPANMTANRDVADVVSRGNQQMGQILRDTSGNPGVPPAMTGAQMPKAGKPW